jgi:phosphoserine phosphatase
MADAAARVGFCFDLDGTLVSTPIFPMVAAAVDLVEEIEVLGRATESGELPFARSLRQRFRILSEVSVTEARRRVGVAAVDADVAAVLAAKVDRSHVLTMLPDCWVPGLAERFGCEVLASSTTVQDDRLHEVTEVIDKGATVLRLRERYDQVVAIGADAGDLAMLEAADIAVAFGLDATPAVRAVADYWVTSGRGLWQLLRPL